MPMKVPGSEPRNIVVIGMPLSHFSLQTLHTHTSARWWRNWMLHGIFPHTTRALQPQDPLGGHSRSK